MKREQEKRLGVKGACDSSLTLFAIINRLEPAVDVAEGVRRAAQGEQALMRR